MRWRAARGSDARYYARHAAHASAAAMPRILRDATRSQRCSSEALRRAPPPMARRTAACCAALRRYSEAQYSVMRGSVYADMHDVVGSAQ